MLAERIHKTPADAKEPSCLTKAKSKEHDLLHGQLHVPGERARQVQDSYSVLGQTECVAYKYKPPKSVLRKRNCRDTARRWIDAAPLILDTETTGLDLNAEVIELALIDLEGNVIFSEMMKPVAPVTEGAYKIHGISDEMLAEKPSWPEIYPRLLKAIAGRDIVIFNSAFDVRMIEQTCQRHGLPMQAFNSHCLMLLYAEFYGERKGSGWKWQNLFKALAQADLQHRPAHRAVGDCLMTADLLKYVASGKCKP